jgi:hypothetical protein
MTNSILTTAVVVIFIIGPFWLIYKIKKHVAKKGPLFTGQSTFGTRMLAIILGILFAGLFAMEFLFSKSFHAMFPVLALALLGYGFGIEQLLNEFQNGRGAKNAPLKNQSSISKEPTIGSLDKDN